MRKASTRIQVDRPETRFRHDGLAQVLANADDQPWYALTSDQRDRYRRLADAAARYRKTA